jgi:Flp pilus assembly pilin Flp
VPLVVAGAIAVVLLSKGKYLTSGVKPLWKLR